MSQKKDRKKYCVLRYRDEFEDYIDVYPSPEDEDYILCEQQDGENWYCKKDEYFFFMTNSLDDISNCLQEQCSITDIRLDNLTPEDRIYLIESLNKQV